MQTTLTLLAVRPQHSESVTVAHRHGAMMTYQYEEFLCSSKVQLLVCGSELGRYLMQPMKKVAICLWQLSLWYHVNLRVEIVQVAESKPRCVAQLHDRMLDINENIHRNIQSCHTFRSVVLAADSVAGPIVTSFV